MDKIKKILCPIDLSANSGMVIEYAINFGRRYNIEPELLYVSTKPPEVYYRFFPDVMTYLASLERNAESEVAKFRQKLETDLDIILRHGDVYQEILSYAREAAVDIIIMHANSYSMIRENRLGMIAHKVIRKADCPVLTLYGEVSSKPVKNILCPLDLSTRSYEGLAQAIALAEVFNANLYVLHVLEIEKFKIEGERGVNKDDTYAILSKHLEDEIKVPIEFKGMKIEKVITRSVDAADGIINFARENEMDLIALATHGHGYWPRVLLGSVTEKVIQIAPCPVITLRLQKGDKDDSKN